jgi:hypothetical protein
MGFHQIAAQLRRPAGVATIGLPPGIPQPGPHLAEEEGDRGGSFTVPSGAVLPLVLLRRCGSGAAGPVAAVIRHLVIGGRLK